MSNISNDQQLRAALNALALDQQRAIGGLFTNSVATLGRDPELARAIAATADRDISETEREEAFRLAKSIATKTYTACGRDADWLTQAEHFVAAACSAVLTPESQVDPKINLAWKAAIQARMAKNCLMMESDTAEIDNEAQKQYKIAQEFTTD
jgi:hypothetical protein